MVFLCVTTLSRMDQEFRSRRMSLLEAQMVVSWRRLEVLVKTRTK
jgi:hypothetical protein